MQFAIIGRTELLLQAAERLIDAGHRLALVVTAKEAAEYIVGPDDFRALAERHDCPFLRTAAIGEKLNELGTLPAIDIAISVNYPGIIPEAVINCFRLGILNAHAGDLPRYRGNACQAWAILNREKRSGLCIHRMIGGELDSGDIIARDFHPVDHSTTVTDLWNWAATRVPDLFLEAIEALSNDPGFVLERQSKDPLHALRCYPRRPEDGRISWSAGADEILRLINASNKPYSGAFADLEGRKLVIWSAEPVDDRENFLAIPGQVTAIGPAWIHVATGQGKIQLNDVEYDGVTTTANKLVSSLRTRLS